ncbi:MAG: competence/damage-inducible protein A [Ignavibacteriae bacterium]|nr:competence/damage-inducible protein A [Ignavibacteriota bacterium]
MVTAKVISIGDEILIGQIVNTNASYINDKLFSIGVQVKKVVTIGDNREDLFHELHDSMQNYDITLITGGLGPTHDDITKPILVDFFKDELILDEEVLVKVRSIFESRNVVMPETNLGQAMKPSRSKVIWNDNGTAPGIYMEEEGRVFIAMPGVPFEMKAMMENSVLYLLKAKFLQNPEYVLRNKTLLTTGIGESFLFESIGDLNELLQGQKMAFLPSPYGVRLRMDVKAATDAEAEEEITRIEKGLYEKVGEFIYGANEDLLEKTVGDLLRDKGLTLATAESCTGGFISQRITDISGSSEYYKGGVISYSNEAKENIINVDRNTLVNYGAVSSETAVEMAVGVKKTMNADVGISATGIAGPTGATETKPIGLTYIAISIGDKVYSKELFLGDNRHRNRIRAAQAALNMLRKELLLIK